MTGSSRVERLGTEKIGKLLLEMASQTTLSLLVYAIYSVTDTYFLSVGINSLAAAGASIISPILIALGGVATTVGAGGVSAVRRYQERMVVREHLAPNPEPGKGGGLPLKRPSFAPASLLNRIRIGTRYREKNEPKFDK